MSRVMAYIIRCQKLLIGQKTGLFLCSVVFKPLVVHFYEDTNDIPNVFSVLFSENRK
jgi:hypothetical protein